MIKLWVRDIIIPTGLGRGGVRPAIFQILLRNKESNLLKPTFYRSPLLKSDGSDFNWKWTGRHGKLFVSDHHKIHRRWSLKVREWNFMELHSPLCCLFHRNIKQLLWNPIPEVTEGMTPIIKPNYFSIKFSSWKSELVPTSGKKGVPIPVVPTGAQIYLPIFQPSLKMS